MNWMLLLYNALLAVVVLDAIASAFVALYMFRLRDRFGWYLALAFTGVAVEAWLGVLTMGFSAPSQRIAVWIIAVRIFARLFKMVTMAALPLYLLGYLNGKH